jgi:Adenosine-deaminase (editase) domain.
MEVNFADQIAELCYSKYTTLAKQGKPNEKEWTLLAGIVKVEDWKRGCDFSNEMAMDVVALGTGSKCIGESKLSPAGDIINDSHAEVMARRGFLRYLYQQVLTTYCTGSSEVFKCFSGGKCVIKDGVTFHFFTSHVPCGDAAIISKVPLCGNSMHSCLTCDAQDSAAFQNKDTTGIDVLGKTQDLVCNLSEMELQTIGGEGHNVRMPVNSGKRKYCNTEGYEQESGSKCVRLNLNSSGGSTCGSKQNLTVSDLLLLEENNSGTVPVSDVYRTGAKCLPFELLQDPRLPGAKYHVVGALRTKPGRGVPTQSFSCSDKFARWNVVGLQGALLALLINEPVYFQSLTIGGGGPFSEKALKRAIIDRLISRNNGGQNWPEDKNVDEASTVGEGLSLPSKYAVGHPLMLQSALPFKHARTPDGMKQPCPSSTVWCKVQER